MRATTSLATIAALLIACAAPDSETDAPVTADVPDPVRAMGNEPFWNVDISSDGGLVYTRLGEESIQFPYLEPEISVDPPAFTYGPVEDASGAHILKVTIIEEPCPDTMADQVHPMTSSATIDGEELRGCARPAEVPAEDAPED